LPNALCRREHAIRVARALRRPLVFGVWQSLSGLVPRRICRSDGEFVIARPRQPMCKACALLEIFTFVGIPPSDGSLPGQQLLQMLVIVEFIVHRSLPSQRVTRAGTYF